MTLWRFLNPCHLIVHHGQFPPFYSLQSPRHLEGGKDSRRKVARVKGVANKPSRSLYTQGAWSWALPHKEVLKGCKYNFCWDHPNYKVVEVRVPNGPTGQILKPSSRLPLLLICGTECTNYFTTPNVVPSWLTSCIFMLSSLLLSTSLTLPG